MRILLTLDYEIHFGRRTGSVARGLLEPTEAIAAVARRHGARLVLFVDAGFLLCLRREMPRARELRADHDAIRRQLDALVAEGHEIQLHIHPHWEDSHWTPQGWKLDLRRYALQAFSPAGIDDVVGRYAALLREIGRAQAATAYRAGGWVLQPFAPLRPALLAHGVCIDSTVFAGGLSESAAQPFDFRAAPRKSRWRFDRDPLRETPWGPFLEVPIASRELPPSFFWRLAAAKKLGGARHRTFGDGEAVAMERGDLARKLLRRSTSVVSLDGFKASFLAAAASDYRRSGMDDFVAIGHPKALTPYSLERLDAFLRSCRADEIGGYARYLPELAAARGVAA
ncbi:MAG TPA: hypothetical protein VFK48_07285 [Usitatibacter sp.]|nr:hypothetical protein [Usitatibacter sp.]